MTDCQYFYEDEVYRVDKKSGRLRYGLILRNADMSSDSEDSDADYGRVKRGQVRVVWYPSGKEQNVAEKNLCLADRSLMPGDVVRRLEKDSQKGYCQDVTVNTCSRIVGTDYVVYDVGTKDFSSLEEFSVDIAVCLYSWIGIIRQIKYKVWLIFPDGSTCILKGVDADKLEDLNECEDSYWEYKERAYYPGQTLSGSLRIFDSAEWLNVTPKLKELCKKKRKTTVRATVEKSEVVGLTIRWRCQAYHMDWMAENLKLTQPDYHVQGEELKRVKMLNVFEPCTVQVGDRHFYTIKENDVILSGHQWKRLEKEVLTAKDNFKSLKERFVANNVKKEDSDDDDEWDTTSTASSTVAEKKRTVVSTKRLKKKKLKRARPRTSDYKPKAPAISFKAGDKVVVKVLCTKSEATVAWQDGSVETGVDSRSLYPIHHLDDQEFFPGDFVSGGSTEEERPFAYGVVKTVDHSARVCGVKWFNPYETKDAPSAIYLEDTEESVYDIRDHYDFKFRPGSIVIRIANFEREEVGGQVLNNQPDGRIHVWWSNGQVSHCWPQDLVKVGEYDTEDGGLWNDDSDFLDSDDSWETVSNDGDDGDGCDSQTESPSKSTPSIKEPEAPSATNAISYYDSSAEVTEYLRSTKLDVEVLEGLLEARKRSSNQCDDVLDAKRFADVYDKCFRLDRAIGVSCFADHHFRDIIKGLKVEASKVISKRLIRGEDKGDDSVGMALLTDNLLSLCAKITEQIAKTQEILEKQLENSVPTHYYKCPERQTARQEAFGMPLAELESWLQVLFLEEKKGDDGSSPSKIKKDDDRGDEDNNNAVFNSSSESFTMLETAPCKHKFTPTSFAPMDPRSFLRVVKKESKLLSGSLPPGIVVRGFQDRIDLYSAMIHGPAGTPYEDGLFFFDFRLPFDYPASPPSCYYIGYVTDRLNPNLYQDGKVCVSLLGTWSGKGTEVWTKESNLLQLLVSIQGLILVKEPFYNEAGYENLRSTQQAQENSRVYNEMAVLKMVQSMSKMIKCPPIAFETEIIRHFHQRGERLMERLNKWCQNSTEELRGDELPEFPLVPASQGFCISLKRALVEFKTSLNSLLERSKSKTVM